MKLQCKLILSALAAAVMLPATMTAQTKKWDDYRAEHGIALPTWNIKTNLLSDLTGSLNLALEFRLGNHASLNVVGQHNPFKFRAKTEGDLTWAQTKWWHLAVQPELRVWFSETFRGHFLGVHGHYVKYDVAGLPHPPFSDWMHNWRFEGDLYGAGIAWGHRWNFSRRWGLELTAGVGYVHVDHTRCTIEPCDDAPVREKRDYFAPTKLGVNLIFGLDTKRAAPVAEPVPVVVPVPEPAVAAPAKVRYEPVFTPVFIIPEAELVKARNESGSAYLEFPTGSAVINPNYRNNATELARIDEMIYRVKSDPDATITGITIVGNASPEGSFLNNLSLSQKRAEALRTHLNRVYGFAHGLITARGGGEDWPGLSKLAAGSYIPGIESLLAIIDGSADYDARERMMMAANRSAYTAMKQEIYPRLRRTDYKLDFEVAPISIERGKEIMRTNPRNLSLNELFLIAQTYRPGSEEFREVNEIAARAFPDNDVANINAAAAAIQRGDLTSAASFLDKVRDRSRVEWNNNMGIVAFMQGDSAHAAQHFRAAGYTAGANAAELEKHLESIR